MCASAASDLGSWAGYDPHVMLRASFANWKSTVIPTMRPLSHQAPSRNIPLAFTLPDPLPGSRSSHWIGNHRTNVLAPPSHRICIDIKRRGYVVLLEPRDDPTIRGLVLDPLLWLLRIPSRGRLQLIRQGWEHRGPSRWLINRRSASRRRGGLPSTPNGIRHEDPKIAWTFWTTTSRPTSMCNWASSINTYRDSDLLAPPRHHIKPRSQEHPDGTKDLPVTRLPRRGMSDRRFWSKWST